MNEPLTPDKELRCPVCGKGKIFTYHASGCISSICSICNRAILWDLNHDNAAAIPRQKSKIPPTE
jgi:uncharacterized protein (DUF983 family)